MNFIVDAPDASPVEVKHVSLVHDNSTFLCYPDNPKAALVLRDDRTGCEWRLDREIMIGHAPTNDIVISAEDGASRRHCRLLATPNGGAIVHDLSERGVVLDGVRTRFAFLEAGSVLAVGRQCFRSRVDGAPFKPRIKDQLIGTSPAMEALRSLIRTYGPNDMPVLILGERGTGKDLVARALHKASPRATKSMVALNCASLSDDLADSLLFGHVKGAFTDAKEDRRGLFEEADGGTLFLDEVAELPPAVQVKLLRVLQDGSFRRIGSTLERHVDVRVVAATNRNLEAAVKAKAFREDLLNRLNTLPLRVPSLRDRRSDIPLLAAFFLDQLTEDKALSKEALVGMMLYPWPGNVRALESTVKRAAILSAGSNLIESCHLVLPGSMELIPFPAATSNWIRA